MLFFSGKERLCNKDDGLVKDQTLKNNDSAQICLGVNCLLLAFPKFKEGKDQYEDDSPRKRSARESRSCSAPPPALGKSHSCSANPTPIHMNPSQKSETDPIQRTDPIPRQSRQLTSRVNLHAKKFENM